MIIDVGDIQRELGASIAFEGHLAVEDMPYQNEILKFPEPLILKGNVTNIGDLLLLRSAAEGTAILECGSCMESYDYPFEFDFEARLNQSGEVEDSDLFLFKGNRIDLKDIVLEYLILELPIRRKCNEECKGLCPSCGANLNAGECPCVPVHEEDTGEGMNEKFKTLKDYFSTNGKEV